MWCDFRSDVKFTSLRVENISGWKMRDLICQRLEGLRRNERLGIWKLNVTKSLKIEDKNLKLDFQVERNLIADRR